MALPDSSPAPCWNVVLPLRPPPALLLAQSSTLAGRAGSVLAPRAGRPGPSRATHSPSHSVPGAAVRDCQVLQLRPSGDLLQPAATLHVPEHRRGQGEHEPARGGHRASLQVRGSPLMVVARVGWGEVELLVEEAVCGGGSQAWSGLFCFYQKSIKP